MPRRFKFKMPNYWSLSRWNQWKECPAKYRFAVTKVWNSRERRMLPRYPQPTVAAMERGTNIHLLFEHYLKGDVKGVPTELSKISKQMRNALRLGGIAEDPWTLTEDLKPTHPKDWDNAWLRAKIDLHLFFDEDAHLSIVDLKTGRVKPYDAQKEIYAGISRIYYPQAETISAELWYSDHGVIDDDKIFTAKEADGLLNKWVARGKRMLSDRKCDPKPSERACRRCQFRSDKKLADGAAGPCDAWKHAA